MMRFENPFDYPGLKELAQHLAEVLAMQEAGETIWVDNLSLTPTTETP